MNGKNKTNISSIKHTALYCRLSKDDGTIGESMSIGSQKLILENHAKNLGFRNYKFYVDDGFSGMNFDRPDFQNMIKDIEDGLVDCVITKDLSRLGRNHIESGAYIEMFFPEHNVRYIAINDGVDSINTAGMDITPFKNILNEFYSRDISKKIKTAKFMRASQGKFMGVTAPFGYKKDPNDKNHLIIDERTAPTVRYIFELALQNYSGQRIIKKLTEERYPKPSYYKPNHFGKMSLDDDKTYDWQSSRISDMLRNPVYKGGMWVQTFSKTHFKQKSRGYIDIPDRVIVENVHEVLIEPSVWQLVQNIIDTHSKFKEPKYAVDNIFRGKLRCSDCGRTLLIKIESKVKKPLLEKTHYECTTYRKLGSKYCASHRIQYLEIYDIILNDIKKHSNELLKNKNKFIEKLGAKYEKLSSKNSKMLQGKLEKLNNRYNEIDQLFLKAYEDYNKGILSEKRLDLVAKSYEKEQSEITENIKSLSEELKNVSVEEESIESFVKQKKNGEVTQKIKILYNFVGDIN